MAELDLGPAPTRANDTVTKAYVDAKVAAGGGGSGTGSGVAGDVPVFVQQAQPTYVGGPYVWHQTDASGNLVTTWVDPVGTPAAAPPTTGMANRWRASAVTGKSNGQAVDTVPADGGVYLVQSNSSQQPTYISSGLNSKPGLRFDGADDFLQNSAGISVPFPYSIVMVANFRDAANTQELVAVSAEVQINQGSAAYQMYNGKSAGGGTPTLGGHLIVASATANNGTMRVNVDGTQVASATSGGLALGASNAGDMRVGAHPQNFWWAAIDFYELFFYTQDLLDPANASDLSTMKAYARQAYALTVA